MMLYFKKRSSKLSGVGRWGHRTIVVVILFVLVGLSEWGRGEVTYTVRRHDTLSSISRKYGTSVSELARRNGITQRNRIYVGQRLRIPTGNSYVSTRSVLPKDLSATRASRRWRHIVIHHSGASTGTVKGMDAYHRQKRHMQNGLAYHFVIGNGNGMRDGEIAVCDRWKKQLNGGHLASAAQNRVSIGICLVGNFDRSRPTPKQMESLQALVQYLMRRCSLRPSAVTTHQEINVIHTRCPGRHFPSKTFLRGIQASS